MIKKISLALFLLLAGVSEGFAQADITTRDLPTAVPQALQNGDAIVTTRNNATVNTVWPPLFPLASTTTPGSIFALDAPTTHAWVTYIDAFGMQHLLQPGFADISGIASVAQLPLPTVSTGGIVKGLAITTNFFVTGLDNTGALSVARPSFSNLSGVADPSQLPTLNNILGNISITQMNSGGGASISTFWRGDGTWAIPPAGGGLQLSAVLSASTTNSINNANFAQRWSWNSLTSETAFTLDSSSMTSGNILALANSNAANSVGKVVSISDATTGSGYGVYSTLSASTNTGYAGYFNNTATGGYAVYANGRIGSSQAIAPSSGGTGVTAAQPNGLFVGSNPVTAGIIAEYPLNEGTGITVNDISGNNNTATFSGSPTWTTYGVQFPGGTSGAAIQTPIKSFVSFLIHECTYAPTGTSYANFPALLGGHGAGIDILMNGESVGGGYNGSQSHSPAVYQLSPNTYTTAVTRQAPPQDCAVIAGTFGGTDHLYIDGNEYSYLTQGNSATHLAISTTGYLLGNEGGNSQTDFNGTQNYALFYSTTLSGSQIQLLTNYIYEKVNARQGAPVYSNTARWPDGNQHITCYGDSLVGGGGFNLPPVDGNSWCNTTYVITNNVYSINSYAFPGASAYVRSTTMQVDYLNYIAPGQRNYCYLSLGSNDMALLNTAGTTASSTFIWNNIISVANQFKAAGCTPILPTVVSRNSRDSQKDVLNNIERAYAAQNGIVLLDIAAIPSLGADGANTNPTPGVTCFNADQTHLGGPGAGTCYNGLTGYGVLAQWLANMVNILDGSTEANPTITTSNAYVETYADNYLLATPASSGTVQLPDCTGLTGIKRFISNAAALAVITVNTSASQTITGLNTVQPGTTGKFVCSLIAASTGGNYWIRTQ